jgi:hypothetical protein
MVFTHRLGIVASSRLSSFGTLNNTFHEAWARSFSSTLGTTINYSPSDVFETFPFPPASALLSLETIGEQYYQHRQSICQTRELGLTSVYNLFHHPEEHDDDIAQLRALHVRMDTAVRDAYGWQDVDLNHGFYLDDAPFDESQLIGLEGRDRNKKLNETRYTISPKARNTILKRLLELNHARHAEEVTRGWWEKTKAGKWKPSKTGKAWLKKTRNAERNHPSAANKHPQKHHNEQQPLINQDTPLFPTPPNPEETP